MDVSLTCRTQAGLIRNGLTQTECDGHAMLGILAGSDTTASAIRAIVFSLLRTPQAYRKLKEEIRDVLAGGDVPSPVPMQTAAGMDYLQVSYPSCVSPPRPSS